MSQNPYDVLGVNKNSTDKEIKKAFREKAKKHHPDKGGDEAEFKKINEAYDVLGDKQKRAQYDQFGSVGGGMGGNGGFGGFGGGGFNAQDFSDAFGGFSDFFGGNSGFGGFGGFGGGGRRQSTKGADLEVELEITFEESMEGVKKSFPVRSQITCDDCDGKGGEDEETCSECHGTGSVAQKFQTPLGVIQQQQVCPKCHGKGKTFKKVCKSCHGEGRKEDRHTLEVKIPQGIEHGTTLRIRGKGDAGKNGSPAGDLYIHIRVKPSKEFVRQGTNIITELEVPILKAILGGKFTVKTFWGEGELTLPENTRDGQTFRLTGKGVKRDGQAGDHLVKVKYEMPKKISKKFRENLESAQEELEKGWF